MDIQKKEFCTICQGRIIFKAFSKGKIFFNKCENCGSIFQNEITEDTPSQYNKKYFTGGADGGYENYLESLSYKRKYFEKILNITINKLNGNNVLEVGCASGLFMSLLKKRGLNVTGMEASREAAQLAKDSGMNVYTGMFPEDFPDQADCFDGVYMLDVIEHFHAPSKVVNEVFSLLKSGGVFVILTPDAEGFFHRLLGKSWPHFKPNEHLWYPTKKSINALLKKTGFVDIYITNFRKKYPLSYLSYGLAKQDSWFVAMVGKFLQNNFFSLIRFPFSLDEQFIIARKPGPSSRRTLGEGYLRRYGPSMALWRTEEIRTYKNIEWVFPVLDLGCGNGYTSTFLQTAPLVGLDINLSDLKIARDNGFYKLLVKGDACRLPFASSFFGTVFSNCVIEHILGLPNCLREIERIIKPGGVLVFSVPTESFRHWLPGAALLDKLRLIKVAECFRRFFSFIMKHYTEKDEVWWRLKLQEAGFEVVEVRPFMNRKRYRTFVFLLPMSLVYKFLKKVTGGKLNLKPLSSVFIKFLEGKDINQPPGKSAGLIIIAVKKMA